MFSRPLKKRLFVLFIDLRRDNLGLMHSHYSLITRVNVQHTNTGGFIFFFSLLKKRKMEKKVLIELKLVNELPLKSSMNCKL